MNRMYIQPRTSVYAVAYLEAVMVNASIIGQNGNPVDGNGEGQGDGTTDDQGNIIMEGKEDFGWGFESDWGDLWAE